MKKIFLVLLALLLIAGTVFAGGSQSGAAPAAADTGLGDYPNKPIQVILPYGPGGGTDLFARAVAKYINLKQPLAIVNVEGGGGLVGAMQGYNTPSDGYTLIAHNPMEVLSYSLSNLTQTPLWSELTPICWAVTDYMATFVNKQSGFKTIQDVVAYAKAHPGELKWGTVGAKTINNIMAMRTIEGLGLKGLVTVVPYDGGAQARTALQGNHIQIGQASLGDFYPIIVSGDAIPVVLVSDKRTSLAPDVPIAAEVGLTGLELLICRGFYGPKGMSPAQVKYLEDAIKATVEKPEFVADIKKFFTDPYFVSAEEGQRRCVEAYNMLKPYYDSF